MFSPERYTAAREGAVVHDRVRRGALLLTGADRLGYLQGLLTNDVASLAAGTGCYAALLTPQGRMIADLRVFERGDSVLLDVPADVAGRVARQLSDFVITEDVTVKDVSESLSHVVVIGEGSARALGTEALRPFESRALRLAGVDVMVAGNDEYGVPAIDVFVDSARKDALIAALSEAGVSTVDDEVAEILRIEAGTPRFGQDMDDDTIPLEAGIEDRAISLTKGCYVGQEIIIRVLHRGQGRVARKLVGLTLDPAARPPAPGETLYAGDRTIGAITSAAWSPALGRPLALGYVHRDFTAPGTGVAAGETRQAATVTALPFAVTAAR